jgi:hypothetical protein
MVCFLNTHKQYQFEIVIARLMRNCALERAIQYAGTVMIEL